MKERGSRFSDWTGFSCIFLEREEQDDEAVVQVDEVASEALLFGTWQSLWAELRALVSGPEYCELVKEIVDLAYRCSNNAQVESRATQFAVKGMVLRSSIIPGKAR